MNEYYFSKAFKEKRNKMKTLLIKGMNINSERQITCGLYAHGELEQMWGYDLVIAYKWGWIMDNVEDGIYDAKFVCPDNTIVKAKVFVWQKGDWIRSNGKPMMQGLVVKVGDNEYMKDAQEKYERKVEYI